MRSRIRYRGIKTLCFVLATIAVLGVFLPGVAEASPAAPSVGTLNVVIQAPDGVPANVVLQGPAKIVATKPPSGASATVTLSMPAGLYSVNLPAITYDGVRYIGHSIKPVVLVLAGKNSLTATFTADGGARDLHLAAISQTGLQLSWTAPAGAKFSLRRSAGSNAPQQRGQGVGIPTNGTSAVDNGLAPGTKYSYSLFTLVHFRWYGPLSITVSTSPPAGSTSASYVAEPSTLIAKPADINSAVTTGSGVKVVLSDQVPTPLVGSAVILPISDGLPGGFLGVVSSVASDGRTIDLVAGGLSDAFDYYELSVDSFTTDPSLLNPSTSGTTAAGGIQAATLTSAKKPMLQAADPAPTPDKVCGNVSADQAITYSPSLALGGHFKTKLDKYNFLGADVPTGASLDMALTAKAVGAASVETSGDYGCSLPLPKLFKMLSVDPVPMALSLEPTAEFTVGGAVNVSNIGATVTGGVQVSGSMSLKKGASFTGSTILDASPLTPQVKVNGSIGLKLGGDLILGPGVVTEKAGVIAGVKGEFDPLDASFKAYFPVGSANFNLCTEAKASLSAGLSLTAKAWLNNWSFSKDITVDALNGEAAYPGSPWDFPKGCNSNQSTPDSLLGAGVSKVDDSTTGSDQQWGHVDGFVPGAKTWVLSTGKISDAVGTPDQFASTDLGLPGDADLTTLAGFPTHDAASYQVTVIPDASTLHVRYVFASEEYPEYVGSQYNDVMAVYVDGKNCAYVPGTSTPVSVNTINAQTNSAYYVDNSTGAAGYHTTMDGLTVPLTCSVPVTPGHPVTVRVAVADTSDGIYDSAVALVDGGIWTD
jgi:hypothetical protein